MEHNLLQNGLVAEISDKSLNETADERLVWSHGFEIVLVLDGIHSTVYGNLRSLSCRSKPGFRIRYISVIFGV